MSTGDTTLTVRDIEVDVVYKDIKNLHIGVYPPQGRVRVAAPTRLGDEDGRLAVIGRLAWIRRRQAQLRAAERQTQREMVTGESHYVWGRRHRLTVIEAPGRPRIEIDGQRLVLTAPADSTAEERRQVLDRWYRRQLREVLPDLITRWETELGVTVPKWTIRRMKTKWGSCNRETRHIWFNVELAKKHPDCLEYILVHEMTHYFERHHGKRFTELMNNHLPNWENSRRLLNSAPLAVETWPTRYDK